METFKIYVDNKDYIIELEVVDEILHFQISDILISDDKYKNVFTYKKLIAKVEALSYFATNINDIKNELASSIKKSQYSFIKVDFFALFTFEITKFSNPKKNFNLELFLYKTDSRQATLMVSELEGKVAKVIKDNQELRDTHQEMKKEIEEITTENIEIKLKIDKLKQEILGNIQSKTAYLNEVSNSKTKSINAKFNYVRDVLSKSYKEIRKSTVFEQLPILRQEDHSILVKFFGLDFDMDKVYDSLIDGDSLDSIKSKTHNLQQILLVADLESGRRFGGYISLPFFTTLDYESTYLTDDPFAFIFSFERKRKFKCTNQKYVVNFTNDGIYFGSGPDIFISDGFNSNNKNYSNILGSYGEGEILEEGYSRNNYLTGVEYFKIKKIEMYQIIFK